MVGIYIELAARPDRSTPTARGPPARSDQRGTVNQPTPEQPADVVARLRATFRSGRTKPVVWRTTQLRRLRELLTTHGEELAAALHVDLGKSSTEAFRTEINFVVREIDHTLEHLDEWLRPESAPVPAHLGEDATAWTQYDPLGVVLVIAPWNYPAQLLLAPMLGALAAGNAVVVKPSELAPATSAFVARRLPEYLDTDAVAVVEGGIPETTALLAERFDHIFYTGNGTVGRIVMTAAAQHLTPVTLELGGKSPAFVDRDADLSVVADRLARGKFLNAGQTCVAPDYVLTDPETARALEPVLAKAVEGLYGADAATSTEYGRIINERHFDRLSGLLDSGRVVVGGGSDRATKYIAPTVLADVDPDSPVMGEEIFGPVLPIVTVPGLDEAVTFINDRDKPLALYVFTESDVTRERLAAETSSGGLGFGLPLAHLTVSDLPFGGVGESGMGNYHGRYSIETFSHRKAVLEKPLG
ncbi:aldehyde dehydrogenase family protein [Streptomyces phaeochromogenes]|uniref:Aldehyde dehydrogenase n=1 Tax=Streptomyces phaeochromogenes TaxID=1923 RepID=A0ABZ1HNP6_STRPH|nr:aldehyde dehydrogenase family protein [Streptomyces phaeochromogenes]WSD20236.1 aldehyde dehydrogenase family protein [Streptomyces phaeochromogenes]WSJ03073.1 aldehyde dehydrogenase family protein [Streptomyces phaeochromogenes]